MVNNGWRCQLDRMKWMNVHRQWKRVFHGKKILVVKQEVEHDHRGWMVMEGDILQFGED